jgi:hypothetical protein
MEERQSLIGRDLEAGRGGGLGWSSYEGAGASQVELERTLRGVSAAQPFLPPTAAGVAAGLMRALVAAGVHRR